MSKPPKVYICVGKDCRKSDSSLHKLLGDLPVCRVEEVRCQKICKGPVIGAQVGGTLHWFKKLRGHVVRSALREALTSKRIPKVLRAHHIKKRAGKLR